MVLAYQGNLEFNSFHFSCECDFEIKKNQRMLSHWIFGFAWEVYWDQILTSQRDYLFGKKLQTCWNLWVHWDCWLCTHADGLCLLFGWTPLPPCAGDQIGRICISSGSWWLNHNPARLLQTLMEFAWGPNNPIWFISKHARNVWICMIILSASVSIKNAFWLRIRKDWGENSTNWFNKLTAFCISG